MVGFNLINQLILSTIKYFVLKVHLTELNSSYVLGGRLREQITSKLLSVINILINILLYT